MLHAIRIPPAPCLTLCALLAATLPCRAEQPLWELGAGVGALSLPHYRGSDQSHHWVLPIPYAVYRGRILRADREGARAVLVDQERLDIDLSLAASPRSRSSGNTARSGMPDLQATAELGPNVNLRLAQFKPEGGEWKLDLRVPLRAVATLERKPHSVGFTLSPVLSLDGRANGWNLGLQAGPLAATRRYHGHFYDVDPAYATAARPAYRARGGYAGWRALASASRRVGDWWLGGFIRSDQMDGAAFADSPLVKRHQQFSFGFAASWVFMVSDERVPDGR